MVGVRVQIQNGILKADLQEKQPRLIWKAGAVQFSYIISSQLEEMK